MKNVTTPTPEQQHHYEKLIGSVIVDVLWESSLDAPLPVLIVSLPTGGTAECVVQKSEAERSAGYLHHSI